MTNSIRAIVCLGDSITSIQEGPSYVTYWQQMANYLTIQPSGVNGEIAAEGLGRLSTDVIQLHPDLVTIMYGHNEVHRQIPPNFFRESIEKMISMLKSNKIPHIWLLTPNQIGNPNLNHYYQPYLEELSGISQKHSLPLIDLWHIFKPHELKEIYTYPSDYLHPNETGHKIIANTLLKAFTKLVNSQLF